MKKVAVLLIITIFLSACEHERTANKTVYTDEISEGVDVEKFEAESVSDMTGISLENASMKPDIDLEPADKTSIIPERMIKEGGIVIQVEDFEKGKKDLNEVLRKNNAYVSVENQYKDSREINSEITIRVKNTYFEKLMEDIEAIAIEVDGRHIELKDVTEEYVDLTARLKAKRKIEERYFDILKKARTIEDILKVEEKLRVIREEIESAEGRLKYLDNRVSLSTIQLRIYQEFEFTYKPQKKDGFFDRIFRSLDQGWQGLLVFIIGIFNIWPLILGGILIVWLIRRRLRKRKMIKSK